MKQAVNPTTKDWVERANLTESGRYQLLAADRRRAVLDILADEGGPIDVRAIAERIATRETDAGVLSASAVERVEISLHHNHLPRMAEYGVIGYRPAQHEIEPPF